MRTATLADIAALIQALALLLFGIGAVTIAPGLRIFLASAAKRRTSISPASALRIVAAQFVRGAVQAKVAESSVTVARCSEEVVRCADQSDRSTFVPDDPRPRRSRFSAALTWAFFGIPGIIAFAATIKVEDAQSNIAGWMQFLGVDRVPEFISSPFADGFALWGAIFVMLMAAYNLPNKFPRASWVLRAPQRAVGRQWCRFQERFVRFDARAKAEAQRLKAVEEERIAQRRQKRK